MMFWYTTVLPALLQLEINHGIYRAFVVEDTCLLAPGIFYHDIEFATRTWRASLFGYGRFDEGAKGPLWHGTKGLCVTAPWCHSLSIVLDNMRPQDFEHFDLWLKKRSKNDLEPGIHLCKPLAGYGHRMSLTSRQGPVFGGAWLPSQAVGQNTDNDAFEGSPLAIRHWVLSCRQQVPGIKRGDPAPCVLECPELFNAGLTMGVYTFSSEWTNGIIGIANMSVEDEIELGSPKCEVVY